MGGVIQVQYIDLPMHDADSTPWANFKRPLLAPNMSTLSSAALAGTRARGATASHGRAASTVACVTAAEAAVGAGTVAVTVAAPVTIPTAAAASTRRRWRSRRGVIWCCVNTLFRSGRVSIPPPWVFFQRAAMELQWRFPSWMEGEGGV